MGRRTATAAALAVAAVLAAATTACGRGGGDVAEAGPIPVSAPDAVRPGGAIADGFTVPDGAVLAGGPVGVGAEGSYAGIDVVDRGWMALMVVPGDPRPVVRALADQSSQAVGIDVAPAAIEDQATPVTSWCRRSGERYRCGGFGITADGRRAVTIDLHRSPPDDGVPAESYVRLTYRNLDPTAAPPWTFPTGDADAPLGPTPPEVQGEWWVLPSPGDRMGSGYWPGNVKPFEVLDGSRLVLPTMGERGGPYEAVLALDGDAAAARRLAARYADQAAAHVGEPRAGDPVRYDVGGGRVVTIWYEAAAGGDSYRLALTTRPDGPALLHIATGYD